MRERNKMNQAKRYTTTQNSQVDVSFETVLFKGVPDSPGLFVPQLIPKITTKQLSEWATLSFPELSLAIAELFIDESEIPREDLRRIINQAYHHSLFFPREVIPIIQFGHTNTFVAELFHGPSLAFKDLAMLVTARLLDYFLHKSNRTATVVVATSGDTGPSCLMALDGLSNVRTVVMFPSKRVSSRQEMQMTNRPYSKTTRVIEVLDATSDSIDMETFKLFADSDFKRDMGLCSLNSVNWSRVLFQIPHFFYAYFKVKQKSPPHTQVSIAVPTGAMGNSVAGVIAMKMGLPLYQLLIAQNENDCAIQFLQNDTVQYNAKEVVPTLAPAIDIQSPYNIERLLWALCQNEPFSAERIKTWMMQINQRESVRVDLSESEKAWKKSKLVGSRHDQQEIKETLIDVKRKYGIVLDPHTCVGACGVLAAAGHPK